ncbi:hypothetical protein pdam_00016929 [Pocillopora damicornis]|uniref:HBS1-like protein N-terminal domain-containing protein n=1 Tax=Pocillopora damicornis TaxID=46731 RepID=A0A3M6UL63_POCDA|nr:hypothetical protein pdam_00016929 [Pocillopora damicornis]
MARHRNYRNYAYEDDMSDDVYGHSVEDYDIAVSPTTAEEFLFRRSNSRDPNLSAYMADRFGRVEEEDEEESDDEPLATSQDYRRPQLDPRSEEKLSSCLDQLHSILGENLDECTAVTALMQHNFDLERALDQILSGGEKQDMKDNSRPAGSKASNNKKEGVLDPVTPLVTALSEKASLGFSTPSTEKKKSMESSPEVPLEEDTDQAKSADTSKQRIAAKNREKEVQEEYDRRQRGKILLNLVVIGE